MALGGVIFDWDGVVINSASLHEKSWEMLANELGLSYRQTTLFLDLEREMKL